MYNCHIDYSQDEMGIMRRCCDIRFLITFPFFIRLFLDSNSLSLNLLLMYFYAWASCYNPKRKSNKDWLKEKCSKIYEILKNEFKFNDDEINHWDYVRNNSFLTHGGFVLYKELGQNEMENIIGELLMNCWYNIEKEIIDFISKKKAETQKVKEENDTT